MSLAPPLYAVGVLLLDNTDHLTWISPSGADHFGLDRNRVPVVHGHARFVDPHTVEVETDSGARPRLRAGGFVIATGSRPYRPPDVDFNHPRVFDSDTILGLDHTPNTVTIYGAGVVGCEYASIFRGLEVKVNLVNNREKLLAFLDDEIIDALSYHLRDQGVVIRHNETYERIEPLPDGVVVHLKSGKKIKSDILLWANGRTGNTQELGLDTAMFELDLESVELAQMIKDDEALASKLGTNGTPAFFINGRFISGAQSFESFAALVDEEKAKAQKLVDAGTPRGQVYDKIMADAEEKPGP